MNNLQSKPLTASRFWLIMALALGLSLIVLLLAPLLGSTPVDLWRALTDATSLDRQILFRVRMPRILFAFVVGGALAISGAAFQAILRNPLASPFTLGVSGGASLGAVLAILLGWQFTFHGFSPLPIASFAGALAVVAVVYGLSRLTRHFSPLTLLLSGVILNYICAALILLIHYFADFSQSFLMMRWMMGGLEVFEYAVLLNVAPLLVPGLAILLASARSFNLLSTGEEWAASRGLDVNRFTSLNYFAASLATGSVVAYSGPIGFVGLIVPHLLRLLLGADHRVLLPLSFLAGGAFLVVCDAAARTVLSPTEIPVGIFTSILGGPFFLWLLLRRGRDLFF